MHKLNIVLEDNMKFCNILELGLPVDNLAIGCEISHVVYKLNNTTQLLFVIRQTQAWHIELSWDKIVGEWLVAR
jgi:hypothetical protein